MTAPSDADLIARLREVADEAQEAMDQDSWVLVGVEEIVTLRAAATRLAEVERQRARAEQCIEQVRESLSHAGFRIDPERADEIAYDIIAAYDAARETPAPAGPKDE